MPSLVVALVSPIILIATIFPSLDLKLASPLIELKYVFVRSFQLDSSRLDIGSIDTYRVADRIVRSEGVVPQNVR